MLNNSIATKFRHLSNISAHQNVNLKCFSTLFHCAVSTPRTSNGATSRKTKSKRNCDNKWMVRVVHCFPDKSVIDFDIILLCVLYMKRYTEITHFRKDLKWITTFKNCCFGRQVQTRKNQNSMNNTQCWYKQNQWQRSALAGP